MIAMLAPVCWAQAGSPPDKDAPPATATVPLPEGAVGGMGDINLYPKRVVLSDRERTASIGLYNRAPAAGEYEISIADMAMRPDGQMLQLSAITDPAEREKVKAASAWLKWSPHRVALPANEALMVRIMTRIPADLPPGEYRAHFSVISVPPEEGPETIEQATGQAVGGDLAVRIRPRFGITIPVIVRVGETTLTTGFADPAIVALPDGSPGLKVRITRQGTRSAFGDISITAPGLKKPIAEMKGVGVYPEIDSRTVVIPFDAGIESAAIARGTRLTLTYTDDDFAPGQTLAKQVYVVP
ncbi:MAG: hypothetical protein NTX28_11410 [Novosphingobium sp.]|nr:hypothetical protein [Novosphingobium sp.]